MSTVTSATSADRTAAADTYTGTSASTRTIKQELGAEDFMQLLAVQMQNQDPMAPMEDTAFIAQMAQFSALEQSQATTDTITALRADQQKLTAASYLGREVTLEDPEGNLVTGEVTAVDVTGSEPRVAVGETYYDFSSVIRVAPYIAPAA